MTYHYLTRKQRKAAVEHVTQTLAEGHQLENPSHFPLWILRWKARIIVKTALYDENGEIVQFSY